MRTGATTTSWVDALARLRPRDHGKGAKRPRPVVVPARPREVPAAGRTEAPAAAPVRRLGVEQACAITGAKRVKKKCCRSTPRCKGCPVVLMRAARAAESGLTGKDLAKAVKRARAA
jgi:hypothetical protein